MGAALGRCKTQAKKDPLCPDSGDIHGFLFQAGSRSECSLVCALLAAMTPAISVLLSRFIQIHFSFGQILLQVTVMTKYHPI